MKAISLVLHNVRSAHNVGAIFRTADAMGVSKIYLTGYTPTPIDRFGREVKEIAKTSLGASRYISWEHTTIQKVRKECREKDIQLVALEQDPRAIAIEKFVPRQRCALLVGNEVRGVSKQLRDTSDAILEIPMYGTKESLNVSTATGIALYALTRAKKA